jgi:hypothetical protein
MHPWTQVLQHQICARSRTFDHELLQGDGHARQLRDVRSQIADLVIPRPRDLVLLLLEIEGEVDLLPLCCLVRPGRSLLRGRGCGLLYFHPLPLCNSLDRSTWPYCLRDSAFCISRARFVKRIHNLISVGQLNSAENITQEKKIKK